MGLIGQVLNVVFGSGGNVVRETAEVFRENAEKGAERSVTVQSGALAQYAAEFGLNNRGLFDRVMDAINRVPRPAMALGTLGLFASAMINPIWFSARMQGIALVPEPLWWLLGVIVSFYFGARHQLKNQQFQKQVAASLSMAPQVMRNLDTLEEMAASRNKMPATTRKEPAVQSPPATPKPHSDFSDNAALADWARGF